MDMQSWIDKFNRDTGDKFERDNRFELFFLPDKGFCELGTTDNMLIINQLCGDGRFWKDKVDEVARQLGSISFCGCTCIVRNIKAYIRLFGYKIESVVSLSDGASQFLCRHKKTGKEGKVSPAFIYKDTGRQAYYVTWEP